MSICVLFSYKHKYIHVWSHICVLSCDVGRWEVLALQCCNIKSVQSYNVNIAMPPTYRVPPLYTRGFASPYNLQLVICNLTCSICIYSRLQYIYIFIYIYIYVLLYYKLSVLHTYSIIYVCNCFTRRCPKSWVTL